MGVTNLSRKDENELRDVLKYLSEKFYKIGCCINGVIRVCADGGVEAAINIEDDTAFKVTIQDDRNDYRAQYLERVTLEEGQHE